MKHSAFISLVALHMASRCAAEVPVNCSIAYDANSPSNQILLTWEAIPTKLYNVLTATALGQPTWPALNLAPLYASNNQVRFHDQKDQAARFYKVVKLDTDPPEIRRLAPSDGAIAVERQSQLKIWLQDETGIDTNSIVLTVGTNLPVTLADSRMVYADGLLTYTPGTNQFLDANAETVTNLLVLSDTQGHWGTNSWSLKLEVPPILASNVFLIGASSPLTLVSSNGDTFVFSYTGASSGLTNGSILVSTDTNFLYQRVVLSLTDDSFNHTVSLVTTQASLTQCIRQGSIRIVGDFAEELAGAGFRAKDAAAGSATAGIPLGGLVIYDNGNIRVQILSGQIGFNPDFTVSGEFQNGRLVSFDSEIAATAQLDMTVQASFQTMGNFEGSAELRPPIRTARLGFIGFVPVLVVAVLEFNRGYEAHLEALGSATWGFTSSRTLALGATLRNGQWSRHERQSSRFTPFTPGWQINGSARAQVYVQPKLTVYLQGLVGPSVDLKSYLEVEGNACVQPGQAGVDVSLYAGLNSTLAIEVLGWDEEWGDLPSWELFNLRELIARKNLTTPVGPPPQTIPNMVWIPCGSFTMGSPPSEPARSTAEGPQTTVTISHGFWMGRHEVTQGEYLAVMGNNPSYYDGNAVVWDAMCFCITEMYIGTDLNRPVETVSWDDAVAYCAGLTTRELNAGRLPAGYAYRLPTEAEWEYACRAGTTTAFHYGPALRSGMANFFGFFEYPPCGGSNYCYNPSGIFLGHPTRVGSYAPNAWGLYDMHGNVWEWCQDWWSPNLPGGNIPDPQGPATGPGRVIRGGAGVFSFADCAYYCRSAYRIYPINMEADRYGDTGFRVVLAPVQP